ncbi:MAG: hypothetical protein NZ551_05490 [Microscillaceae bacterium]|nr:hypothetical protein [Microscillaceae bacterium]MDW8460649.1 hypothetical protein [Cytophagales bacterium]
MKTNFIQFACGPVHLHKRAIFSVLSLAAFYELQPNERFIIFTDQPDYYKKFLANIPVEYIRVTQNDLKSMMGNDDLIHRVKIAIIEKATQLYPHHQIFYTDSDTFIISPLKPLLKQISPEVSLMHCFEFYMGNVPPDYSPKPITQDFSQMVKSNSFILNGEEITIPNADFSSWNAGLIGLHPTHFPLLKQVYELTDQWYSKVRHHGAEQFAFSYILEKNTKIFLAEAYCYHYWYAIKKKIADELLAEQINEQFEKFNLEQRIAWAKKLAQKLPKLFQTHYYTLQNNMALAFQQGYYWQGYMKALQNLFRKPKHTIEILKDAGYYTKKLFIK